MHEDGDNCRRSAKLPAGAKEIQKNMEIRSFELTQDEVHGIILISAESTSFSREIPPERRVNKNGGFPP
jgi:hypothetical protein